MLTRVKGAFSFEDLRTCNGQTYNTFREAALESGLIENNAEWFECLREASQIKSACQMRELFVSIIVNGLAPNYRELWEQFKEHFIDDFVYRANTRDFNYLLICEQNALLDIDRLLSNFGKFLANFADMPQINFTSLNHFNFR